MAYLATQQIELENSENSQDEILLGSATLKPLSNRFGGYQTIDAKGYQLLLEYRSPNQVAQKITLTEVLRGELSQHPDWVKDKAVMIGTTAPSAKDLFYTPYRSSNSDAHQMAGVLVHAQQFSQIVSLALGESALVRSWLESSEILWIIVWASFASSLTWCIRRLIILVASLASLIGLLIGLSLILFAQNIWIPIAAPLVTLAMTASMGVAYRTYRTQQEQQKIMTILPKTDIGYMPDRSPEQKLTNQNLD